MVLSRDAVALSMPQLPYRLRSLGRENLKHAFF